MQQILLPYVLFLSYDQFLRRLSGRLDKAEVTERDSYVDTVAASEVINNKCPPLAEQSCNGACNSACSVA